MRLNLISKRFNRLTVTRRAANSSSGKTRWVCRCDCGTKVTVIGTDLNSGHSQSCGCLHRELLKSQKTTHGQSDSLEYKSWCNLRSRCYNKNNPKYSRYGGRGIKVCKRWDDFATFLQDMGHKPKRGYSIERRNNDGNYEPKNCVWADAKTQARNTRRTRYVQIGSRRGKLTELADELRIRPGTLKQRARRQSLGTRYAD